MRTLLAICILLIICISVFAMPDSTSYFHFGIKEGFPANNVYSVIQDRDGYLWFATENGVVKYNGYHFKVFNSSNGLPISDVWQLTEDHQGRIWLGAHMNEIGYLKDDKYKSVFKYDKNIHPGVILSDDRNAIMTVWGMDGGLMGVKGDSVCTINLNLQQHRLFACWLTPYFSFLTVGFNKNVYEYRIKNGRPLCVRKCAMPNYLNDVFFNGNVSFFCDSAVIITGRHNESYFFIQDFKKCSFQRFDLSRLSGDANELMYNTYASATKDTVFLITNRYVYLLNKKFEITDRRKVSDITSGNGLVSYYLKDSDGNKWYTSPSSSAWCHFVTQNILHKERSKFENLHFLGSLENGNTYWNNKGNQLYELDTAGHFKKLNFPQSLIPYMIAGKRTDEFYITTNKGMYIYNRRKEKAVNIVERINAYEHLNHTVRDNVGFSDKKSISIAIQAYSKVYPVDSNRLIVLNGYKASLFTWNGSKLTNKEIAQDRFTGAYYDSIRKQCWLYNINKLLLYDISRGRLITIKSNLTNKLGVKNIIAVEGDMFGNTYVLDNDQIVVSNSLGKRVSALHCPFNLSDVQINATDKWLILAGKFGLAYASIKGLGDISEFRIVANNRQSYYNVLFSLTVINGKIIINTDSGFYSVKMCDLVVNKSLINAGDSNLMRLALIYPYQHSLNKGDTIILKPREQKIGLDVINFLGNGVVQYSYRIEGINTEWQQSSSGELFAGNLKPDLYYKVTCMAKDDVWVSKGKVFYIYVSPYWWQTHTWRTIFWVSGIVLVLFVLLLVVLITRFFVERSNEKKRMMTELELRAVYAQINPHFIFNTLSSALYYINKKRFDDAYTHVNKFSRLLRSYLKSSQDRYITLAEEIDMLRNYIELQKTRFEEKFEYEVVVDNKLAVKNIQLPSLLLQPLVENAINHGLFHKGAGGFLSLRFEQGANSEELICIIEDNGVGRERSKEIKKESSTQRDSYGTKLTTQLIDIFKEFEHMDIKLEYIDKPLPESGTIVKLIIRNLKYVMG